MAKASALEKGMYIVYKKNPHQVVEREFVKPGKGSAFVRLKLRATIGGGVLRETLSSETQVEEADIQKRLSQFLYREGEEWHFMDSENYEQQTLHTEALPTSAKYLVEGQSYPLVSWNGTVIDIEVPPKVSLGVVQTENAIRGNTVSGATKPATLQGGITVQLPLFIKNGDHVIINTETEEYVERA